MNQNNLRKRLIVFSIIIICGFSSSYYFLRKSKQPTAQETKTPLDKKEDIVTVTLLSESFDFENAPEASTEKAASGTRSFKLTPKIEYGFGVNKSIKDIPNYQNLKQINVDIKCWMKKNIDAVYVLSIDDAAGKNIVWEGKPIVCDKNGTWCSCQFTYDLKPDAVKSDYTIKLYPWNKAKEEFFIDDISVHYKGIEKVSVASSVNSSGTNFFYDFEKPDGLTGTESIKQTTSHSGKMACDLTGGREYSPLVIKTVGQVSSSQVKKISASVWIYPLTDNPNAVLTASITNSKGEAIFWDGKSTENKSFIKNKWTKLNAAFAIPSGKISLEDKIQVNVWNKGRTDLIIDDLEIVYGENADRKGESSTIDANSIYEKQFIPQKNKPPFKTIYFTKQEINNNAIANFSPNDEFIVGDFIKDKNNLDEIICIKAGKAEMFMYSPESKQFKNVSGKAMSADSLLKTKKINDKSKGIAFFKSTDITYCGDYLGNNKNEILKLNTDWRFDLKLIEQNKEDYTITGNIDFKGYSNDYNPKYYEFTKILSGKFITSSKSSLIVISYNCIDTDFNGKHCNQLENIPTLPNCVSLYSIESK